MANICELALSCAPEDVVDLSSDIVSPHRCETVVKECFAVLARVETQMGVGVFIAARVAEPNIVALAREPESGCQFWLLTNPAISRV